MKRRKLLEKMSARVSTDTETNVTFSSFMRELRQDRPNDVSTFLAAFKKAFDEASEQNLEDLEQVALLEAMHAIRNPSQS